MTRTVGAWRSVVSAAHRLGLEIDVLSPRVLEALADRSLVSRIVRESGVPHGLASAVLAEYRERLIYAFTAMALDLLEEAIAFALAGEPWAQRALRLTLRHGGETVEVVVRTPPPWELLTVKRAEGGYALVDWRGRVVLREPALVFRAARSLDRRTALSMLESALAESVRCGLCEATGSGGGELLLVTGPGLEAEYSLALDKYRVRAGNAFFEEVLGLHLPVEVRYEAEGAIPALVDPAGLLARTLYEEPSRFARLVAEHAAEHGGNVVRAEGGPNHILLILAGGSRAECRTP